MRSSLDGGLGRQAAHRYCRWLTGRAGSHFSLSFRVLPAARRQAMEAVYAFCRAVDDAVDRDNAQPQEAQRELDRWRRELAAAGQGMPTHPILVALEPVRERFRIPAAYLEKLVTGVEMDLHRRRYRTFGELRVYCEHVASVVGLISVRVFGCRHPASDRYAVSLGIALQLTNILRDVKADAEQGRVYLPGEDLDRFGVREEDLAKGRMSGSFRRLAEFECARARSFFQEAEQAMGEAAEGRRLVPARVMGAVYSRILKRIEAVGYDVFSHRIQIPRSRQLWAGLQCLLTRRSS